MSVATTLMAGLAAATSRRRGATATWALLLPVTAAVIAVTCHQWLVLWLAPPEAIPQIDYVQMQLASLTVVPAMFALFGGAAALIRATLWYHWLVAGAAIAAGLFALGPLLISAGVPVDHRAFFGLAGLGVTAWVIVEATRMLGTR